MRKITFDFSGSETQRLEIKIEARALILYTQPRFLSIFS